MTLYTFLNAFQYVVRQKWRLRQSTTKLVKHKQLKHKNDIGKLLQLERCEIGGCAGKFVKFKLKLKVLLRIFNTFYFKLLEFQKK